MTARREHNHHPLWVAGLGPVATCTEHYWQALRPHPVGRAAVAR